MALQPLTVVLAFLPLAACSSPGSHSLLGVQDVRRAPRGPVPELEETVRVVDTAALAPLAFAELLDLLARADVVFVGETHLDDVTHRVELALLEGLHARRDGKVVLSLEMFERDVQPVLDEYLDGGCDEASFLARARPWGNYRTDYRPLVEFAREHGIPVVAANAPAGLRRKLSGGGKAALEALAPAERLLLPEEILPASGAYWERVDRATRGHMNFASLPDEQRLYSGQNLWDNSMGAACARALQEHPGASVVHVVGGFHVQYRDGTAAQLRRRAPHARVAVVEVVPAPGLFQARPERDAAQADYLIYAAEHARSVSDGLFAVSAPAELRYSIDVPDTASATQRAPLLVWLPDAGQRPADARAFWRAALGEEVALAVVEPPFPWPADDLAPGGRWSTSGNLRADLGRVQTSLERLVEYATRRLPVDGRRVVIAGDGLGARAVLWSALYTQWLPARFVAVAPRGAGALRLEGLPDQAPATLDVLALVEAEDLGAFEWIRGDYRGVGTPTELVALAPRADRQRQVEGTLRAALGLPPRAEASPAPILCVLERDLPRARQWAAIHARRLEGAGRPARVVLASDLDGSQDPERVQRLAIGGLWALPDLATGHGLPLAPGDFGGTTVLVVPAGTAPEERAAWQALERDQVLRQRSFFAGLRVALADGQPGLAQVLTELAAAEARSVLVVPATFCAAPAEMRALADGVRDLGLELDLAWLPGLGGELCAGSGE